jgi:hypothetical protein
MSSITFEHKITKFEVDSHCILLRDEKKVDFSANITGQKVVVTVGAKTYTASINDYYVDGKFQAGMHFDPNNDSEKRFFMEQSILTGHVAKITLTKGAPLQDDRFPLTVDISIPVKK